MNNFTALMYNFDKAFSDVSGFLVDKCHEFEPLCFNGEEIVSSLEFDCGGRGFIVMVMKKLDIDKAADYYIAKFALPSAVPYQEVFDEILNICAGMVSRDFVKIAGCDMRICSPKDVDVVFPPNKESECIKLISDNNLEFKFYFLAKDELI